MKTLGRIPQLHRFSLAGLLLFVSLLASTQRSRLSLRLGSGATRQAKRALEHSRRRCVRQPDRRLLAGQLGQ